MMFSLLQLFTTVMITLAWKLVKIYFHPHKEAECRDPARSLPAVNTQEDIFTNAHDFVIENFISFSQTEDARKAEEYDRWRKADDAVVKLLARAMPGAMLHSEARVYAPRCDEGTRQSLRNHIVEWGRNNGEIYPLLWLSGPAAVGKSAVAQNVAEELKKAELLGGVFFFSRPNNRDNPNVVIPTLVYQLAVLLPEYKLIIGQQFKDDPLIFDQSRRSQFEALISDPFLPDLSHRPLTLLSHLSEQLLMSLFHRPLLIVLDGLDECKDRAAQREFVEMIIHHAQRDRDSRLRWMICSRPEPHLTSAFSSKDCQKICLHTELEVDDDEARKDALCILRKGFADIRERYPDQLASDWPHPGDIYFIADRASGHLGFASFIIRFIGDEEYDNPSGQLEVCLKFLEHTGPSGHLNPLHPLDLLYTQILSDIPKATLPTTKRILGLFTLYGNEGLTALIHANFLGLDQAAFYHSLQRLHSVVLVPPASEASTQPIRIYHASFSDYLRDKTRSGEFVLDEGAIHLYVATRGLEWLSHFCKEPSDRRTLPKLAWSEDITSPQNESILDSVGEFAFTHCWRAFPRVPKSFLSILIEVLKDFDFNVTYSKWEDKAKEFAYFIRWLVSSDAKTFASVDHEHSEKPGTKDEIGIIWDEGDPHTFVKPFLTDAGCTDCYLSIHLRLRTRTKASFHLVLSTDIEEKCQAREDDIVIVTTESGESYFTDLLIREVFHHALQFVRYYTVVRDPCAVRAVHPEYGRRIVLVTPPEFGYGIKSDKVALSHTRNWLENIYGNNFKIGGIIYVHSFTNSHTIASPSDVLQAFDGLCSDLAAACMLLVMNEWKIDLISADEWEVQLKEGPWKDLIAHGACVHRLAGSTEEEAWCIVNRLLETANTRESLKDVLEHLPPAKKSNGTRLTEEESRGV
ncbi:hypothetical protein D9756_009631 [Leucocoprinus leucothites]|uniref:Nephrocystin 3-like N-terminal domain-containing protein n=1 Tax=Leucocoprinus leucothites TaxID=201217 RepID=A0A8H5CWR1_9AGAR|nr:hypothetical protein D9756_009631 [Leucoagaricus leucothites]